MHSVQLFLPDFTLLFPISALTISNIQPDFTGDWECRVRTSRGNTTRTVHIVVLETSAKYCGAERVANNKGEFKLVHKIWLTSTCGLKNVLLDLMLGWCLSCGHTYFQLFHTFNCLIGLKWLFGAFLETKLHQQAKGLFIDINNRFL